MIDLSGREFKLLLEPDVLGGKDGLDAAKDFKGLLVEAVKDVFDKTKNGEPCFEGKFDQEKRRIIHFWDDAARSLKSHDFFVRTRTEADENWEAPGKPELTLKFRSEDVVLAALAHAMMRNGSHRLVKDGDSDAKLEEDIGRLQIEVAPKSVVRPGSPKMRSRFSASCEAKLEKDGKFEIGDLMECIPAFERCYRMATGEAPPEPGTDLGRGPEVRELVFGEFKIKLEKKLEADCCLSVWDIAAPVSLRIVEFSYKVPLERETWSENAARSVVQLFLGLQSRLPTDVEFTSKTEFALP